MIQIQIPYLDSLQMVNELDLTNLPRILNIYGFGIKAFQIYHFTIQIQIHNTLNRIINLIELNLMSIFFVNNHDFYSEKC